MSGLKTEAGAEQMNGHGPSAEEFQNSVCCNGREQQKGLAKQGLVYGLLIHAVLFFRLCFMMNVCVTTFF